MRGEERICGAKTEDGTKGRMEKDTVEQKKSDLNQGEGKEDQKGRKGKEGQSFLEG